MAWGQRKGIDDILERLQSDAKFRSLYLMKNRPFGPNEAEKLCKALTKNSTLEELDLSSHTISPEVAAYFADLLTVNNTLQSISLGNSTFGDQALEQLCRGLASNKSLQKLDLECKGITHVGCTHLAAALTSNTTLNELVLSRNDIRAEGVTALVADNSLANVRVLHLSGCSLDNIHASKAASELLLTTPDLEALHYQNNSLESDTAIEAWASGLKSCTKLRKLVLTSTKINVTEVDAFASSIPSSIQYMDLSNTALGASGIEAIAQSQTNNGNYANLETLILCDSGADSAALAPLANTLNALAVLDIGGHDLYDRNDALEALASSPSLVSLRLHNCKLGDQGIARIGDLATSNSAFTSLKDLDISFNAINQEALISFLKVLIDAATAFEQLNMLIVAGNPGLESDDVDEIVSELGQARPHLMVVRRNADTGERDN